MTPWGWMTTKSHGRQLSWATWAPSPIDFLDIVFRLEKAFDIKIPQGELLPQDVLTSSEYVVDGKMTDEGLEELRKRIPFVDLDKFAENPVVQDFSNVMTVADMCRYVETKVEVTE